MALKDTIKLKVNDFINRGDFDGSFNIEVNNEPILGKIVFSSFYDINGKPIDMNKFNVKVGLYRDGKKIHEKMSDGNSFVIFDKLKFGKYQTKVEGIFDKEGKKVDKIKYNDSFKDYSISIEKPVDYNGAYVFTLDKATAKKFFTVNGVEYNEDGQVVSDSNIYYDVRLVSKDINTGVKMKIDFTDKDGKVLETLETDDNGFARTKNKYDASKVYYFKIGDKSFKTEVSTGSVELPNEIKANLVKRNKVTGKEEIVKEVTISKANGWTYVEADLPTSELGQELEYFYKETTTGNFTSKHINRYDNGFLTEITNDYKFVAAGASYKLEAGFTPNTGVRSFK